MATDVAGERLGETKLQFIDAERIMDGSFSARLRNARRPLSRQAVAERAGVTADDIRMAETCPGHLSIGKISAICNALDINCYDLTESIGRSFTDNTGSR